MLLFIAHARHGTLPSQFSTIQYNHGIIWLVYDSNQTRTKHKAIEEVNQTVFDEKTKHFSYPDYFTNLVCQHQGCGQRGPDN